MPTSLFPSLTINWLTEPEEVDFIDAYNVLSLIINPKKIDKILKELNKSEIQHQKAKDIMRFSLHSVCCKEDKEVQYNISKIQ
jgi:hypothetical protein